MDKHGKNNSARSLAREFDKEKKIADRMTLDSRIGKSLKLIPNLGRIVKQIEAMKIAK